MPYRLTYVDGTGRASKRDVGRPGYCGLRSFVAHCKMRDATRTFLYERVAEAIDLDTGEILSGGELLDIVKGIHDNRTHIA
jgi:altronate dehydratase